MKRIDWYNSVKADQFEELLYIKYWWENLYRTFDKTIIISCKLFELLKIFYLLFSTLWILCVQHKAIIKKMYFFPRASPTIHRQIIWLCAFFLYAKRVYQTTVLLLKNTIALVLQIWYFWRIYTCNDWCITRCFSQKSYVIINVRFKK